MNSKNRGHRGYKTGIRGAEQKELINEDKEGEVEVIIMSIFFFILLTHWSSGPIK